MSWEDWELSGLMRQIPEDDTPFMKLLKQGDPEAVRRANEMRSNEALRRLFIREED